VLLLKCCLTEQLARRWRNWVAFVNSIVEFLKTGKTKDSLSSAQQEEITNAALIYYIECKLHVSFAR
jgi:hypothetical protein